MNETIRKQCTAAKSIRKKEGGRGGHKYRSNDLEKTINLLASPKKTADLAPEFKG